jgi:hypothetical protein
MYWSRARAAELIASTGIWLPASGCPLRGSINCVCAVAKFPARINSVGTVAY